MVVVFTALTAVLTYPQAFHLADRVHDDGDPLLNAWALAWVAHQLPRAPAHLFDANIFYPERRTLAYSETLLLPGALAAPLHWLGAGPILVHNLVFLSGFAISGAGTALLVRLLTNSTAAAVVAGLVFAFLPYRIDHFPHLQLQQTQCLPFAMWAFHRLLQTGRLRYGAWYGAFTAGQLLSCMYYGLFLIPYMAVVCGTQLVARFTASGDAAAPGAARRVDPVVKGLLVAAAIAAVAVVPVAKAYLGAREVVGERGREEVVRGSATWQNYLAPAEANALYGRAFARFMAGERRLFPGFVAIALAVVGLWPARRSRHETRREHESPQDDRPRKTPTDDEPTLPTVDTADTRAAHHRAFRVFEVSGFRVDATRLAYALGLLVAFDVSLGFNGFTYTLLYDYFLPFRALRIPARMGVFTGFSLAVLAGFGAARLLARIRGARGRVLVAGVLGVLMLAEYASKPIDLMTIPKQPPEVYADIIRDRADSPTAALLELPASFLDDPTYLYYSTFHWQHLVNGYSGFFPPSYRALLDTLKEFPTDSALIELRVRGVRYVVVHGERMIGTRYQRLVPRLDSRADLRLVSRRPWFDGYKHGEISAYRVLY